MNKRPLSVVVIGWLFIVAGLVGLVYHAGEFRTLRPGQYSLVCVVRVLAVLGGIFLLGGHGWARWLLVAWLAYHVVLSAFHHETAGLVMHAVLLAVITYLLCRPAAAAYVRRAREAPAA